jgi:hypothetical protein
MGVEMKVKFHYGMRLTELVQAYQDDERVAKILDLLYTREYGRKKLYESLCEEMDDEEAEEYVCRLREFGLIDTRIRHLKIGSRGSYSISPLARKIVDVVHQFNRDTLTEAQSD